MGCAASVAVDVVNTSDSEAPQCIEKQTSDPDGRKEVSLNHKDAADNRNQGAKTNERLSPNVRADANGLASTAAERASASESLGDSVAYGSFVSSQLFDSADQLSGPPSLDEDSAAAARVQSLVRAQLARKTSKSSMDAPRPRTRSLSQGASSPKISTSESSPKISSAAGVENPMLIPLTPPISPNISPSLSASFGNLAGIRAHSSHVIIGDSIAASGDVGHHNKSIQSIVRS
eukprot:TRINITY_DN10414_c0_g1_i1.p1 TRINITY_DN10414_c0_g1~~TRINITY_DN10414_c0_g1_i1.p1  ORF type:complete len:233 (+),score=59.51 TRINITY_DN10414_c0_g1_i1:65-763(+)